MVSNVESQGVGKCFERAFEDEQAYKDCVALNDEEKLPPSLLDSPDLTGGVEQCNCVCYYVEGQTKGETQPTDEVPTGSPTG